MTGRAWLISELAALLILVVALTVMFMLPAPGGHTTPGKGWQPCGHTRDRQVVYCVPQP
jgi:hypothetical protein